MFRLAISLWSAVWLPLTGIVFSGTTTAISAAENGRTNVVLFLVDDLGQRDLSCYGSSFYETPNIDRLAADGIRLTNAYAACPVCSPTRASLLTGRYPQRTRITDYIGAPQPEKWKRNTKHLPAAYSEHLALEEVTIAEMLRTAGYATFFAGKWHLGGEGFSPEDQGFDINKGGLAAGGPYGGKKYFSPYGNPKLSDGLDGEHLPDRLATEANAFISDHRDAPFFVYFPFYSVHTPLMSRPDLQKKYEAKRSQRIAFDVFGGEFPRRVRVSQDHAIYAGMVEAMDQAVGKVLKNLDELKLSAKTLVIFTSDNGGLSTSEGSPTSNAPLRAGKGWMYEGGIRTAAIARWPGVIPAGQISDEPIISADYFPTILEATGVAAPDTVRLDGVSLLATLKGDNTRLNRPLFWHYPHYGNQGGAPGAAILENGWKLIEWFDEGRVELFCLAEDPGESSNKTDSEPDRVNDLRQKLHAWQAEVGARPSTLNPAYNPALPSGRE